MGKDGKGKWYEVICCRSGEALGYIQATAKCFAAAIAQEVGVQGKIRRLALDPG